MDLVDKFLREKTHYTELERIKKLLVDTMKKYNFFDLLFDYDAKKDYNQYLPEQMVDVSNLRYSEGNVVLITFGRSSFKEDAEDIKVKIIINKASIKDCILEAITNDGLIYTDVTFFSDSPTKHKLKFVITSKEEKERRESKKSVPYEPWTNPSHSDYLTRKHLNMLN